MTHIEELREVIHSLHGGEATHRESVPVKETWNGETIWDGIVEVFHLKGHPKTDTVYAWLHDTGKPNAREQHVTVLHIDPATTPVLAVRAFIVQEYQMPRQPKPRPVGRPKLPKGEAKAAPIQVRLNPEDRKRFEAAAKSSQQKLSEWIRCTLNAAVQA